MRIIGSSITPDRKDGALLLDEQELQPARSTYMNATYFDEIYHVRAAVEYIQNVDIYENTHPTLGKVLIMLGIEIFGFTPFGYRFMGTLFGTLMLPLMYLILKYIFGKTKIATMGTILLASGFMHYAQTRIATIDSYGTFFILAMYLFMYKYYSLPLDTPFKKTLPSLFLSGLMFGLGIASKWTAFYGAVGLAVLWLIRQIRIYLFKKNTEKHDFSSYITQKIAYSVIFFIIIPVTIYTVSFIPYLLVEHEPVTLSSMANKMIQTSVDMYNYHSQVNQPHPYQSSWWQWLINWRPLLFYYNSPAAGYRSSIATLLNPLLAWAGIVAIIWLVIHVVRDFIKTKQLNMKATFILVGYLACLLPQVFISRTLFIYHYFPSTIFLIMAIAYIMDGIDEHTNKRQKWINVAFTVASVVLFIMFLPSISGITVPEWYLQYFIRWLPSWPL